jgi:hypothetical protein
MKATMIDIWAYQSALTRRLLAWSLFSLIAGLVMQMGGVVLRAAGMQFVAWGAIDAGIALVGRNQSRQRKASADADTPAVLAAETSKLHRLLWLNTALDVLYMVAGLAAARRRGDERWRGHGLGIVVQGGFLFIFDLLHALPLAPERHSSP